MKCDIKPTSKHCVLTAINHFGNGAADGFHEIPSFTPVSMRMAAAAKSAEAV